METYLSLGIFVVSFIAVALFLYLIERKYKKKLALSKNSPKYISKQKLKILKNSNKGAKEKLQKLNTIARDFFKQQYNFGENLGYAELISRFEEKGIEEGKEFCKTILKFNYGKKEPSRENLQKLMTVFENLVDSSEDTKSKEKQDKKEKDRKTEEQGSENQEKKDDKNVEEEKKWRERIKEIQRVKEEVGKDLGKIHFNKRLKKLAEKEISSKKELNSLLSKNHESYKKLSSIEPQIKETYKKFQEFFQKVLRESEETKKKELRNILKEWSREQNESLKGEINPFRQQFEILRILRKYFSKIKKIIFSEPFH